MAYCPMMMMMIFGSYVIYLVLSMIVNGFSSLFRFNHEEGWKSRNYLPSAVKINNLLILSWYGEGRVLLADWRFVSANCRRLISSPIDLFSLQLFDMNQWERPENNLLFPAQTVSQSFSCCSISCLWLRTMP